MTFEELQAIFDSNKDIEVSRFEGTVLDNHRTTAGIFALHAAARRSCRALREQGNEGLQAERTFLRRYRRMQRALMRASKNLLPNNFIEGALTCRRS